MSGCEIYYCCNPLIRGSNFCEKHHSKLKGALPAEERAYRNEQVALAALEALAAAEKKVDGLRKAGRLPVKEVMLCPNCGSVSHSTTAQCRVVDDLRAQLAAMTKERDEAMALFRDADSTAQSVVGMISAAIARAEKAEAELARVQARLADVEEVAQLARDVCVDLVRLDELETALGYGPDPEADRWVYTPPHASEHAGEVVTVLGRGRFKAKGTAGVSTAGTWLDVVEYLGADGVHYNRPVDDFNKLFVKKVKP